MNSTPPEPEAHPTKLLPTDHRTELKNPPPSDNRVRLRIFHEFERPRNGREVIIPIPGPAPLSIPTATLLRAISASIDTTRYTPHVHDPTADCFISLLSTPPASILAEPPPSHHRPPRALPRIDVKLIGTLGAPLPSAGALALQAVCNSGDAGLTGRWFGMGIARGKTASNHGTLWRTALQLGASLTFTIGRRYERKVEGAADVYKTLRQVPCIGYADVGSFLEAAPVDAQIVAVEYGGVDLVEFQHPKRALYVLGSEDCGLPPALIQRAHCYVSVPTVEGRPSSLNVAAAGAIVMYDRLHKERIAKRAKNN